jgi:hypothetical protein
VAAIQPKVKSLVNYVRQKTWVVPDLALSEVIAELGRSPDDTNGLLLIYHGYSTLDLFTLYHGIVSYKSEELDKLKDPEHAKSFRHNVEHAMNVRWKQYSTAPYSNVDEDFINC